MIVVEVDGVGHVGGEVSLSQVTTYADGRVVCVCAPGDEPDQLETGAMAWLSGWYAAHVPAGFYTIVEISSGEVVLQAPPDAIVTTGTLAAVGWLAIEDNLRLCDASPAWVLGDTARARWYACDLSLTQNTSRALPFRGGLAAIDGLTISHSAARRIGWTGTASVTVREETTGVACVLASGNFDGSEEFTTWGSPAVNGGGATVSLPAQPPLIDTEALSVTADATDNGNGTWTQYGRRGVLHTEVAPHGAASRVLSQPGAPVGLGVRVYIYPPTATSHADRALVYRGVIQSADLDDLTLRQSLATVSEVYEPRLVDALETTTVALIPGIVGTAVSFTVTHQPGTTWRWYRFGPLVARFAERELVSTDADGVQTWTYRQTETAEALYQLARVQRSESPDDVGIGWAMTWVFDSATGVPSLIPYPPAGRKLSLGHLFREVDWAGADTAAISHNLLLYFTGVGTVGELSEGGSVSVVYGEAHAGGPRDVWVNPVTAILTILVSAGGYAPEATDLDDAPAEFGCAIPLSRIDLDSFTEIARRLTSEGIRAGNVWLDYSKEARVSDLLSDLCGTYGLALVTTRTGQVRLVDLAHVAPTGATSTLTEANIAVVYGGNPDISLSVRTETITESSSVTYDAPWLPPSDPRSRQTVTARTAGYGSAQRFKRVAKTTTSRNPKFAAAVDDTSRDALAQRWAVLLSVLRGIVPVLSARVLPSWAPDVGDLVRVTLPSLPALWGSGGADEVIGRVVNRQAMHMALQDSELPEQVEIALLWSRSLSRRWVASARVESVTDASAFDVEQPAVFAAGFDSDLDLFAVGDRVWLWSSTMSDVGVVTPGVIGSLNPTTGAVTLSTPCKDGSSADVTPSAGDILTLSRSADNADTAATWAWIGTRWGS